MDAALDLEMLVTDSYTGKYFLDQINGMADATGLEAKVKNKIQVSYILYSLMKLYNFF